MKRKSIKLIATTLLLSTMLSFSSLAAWEQSEQGWKYKDDNTQQYVTATWIESASEAGLWYYIGADGIMATNTTVDGVYYVNEAGEWREGSSSQKVSTPVTNQNQNASTSFQDLLIDVGDKPIQSDPEFDQEFNEGILR